jgi:heptosyltransferase-2
VRAEWLRFHDAAAALGAAPAEPPRVEWDAEADEIAEQVWDDWGVRPGEPVFAVVPAAAWPTKEWSEQRTRELAGRLVSEGARVLLVSTSSERQRLSDLSGWAERESQAHWFTDRLPAIPALLARCRAAVTPDSGLMHLAAAVGTPVVALFGSTSPELGFAPAGTGHREINLGLPCQPCALHGRRECPLGHQDCMGGIAPDRVLGELEPFRAENAEPENV